MNGREGQSGAVPEDTPLQALWPDTYDIRHSGVGIMGVLNATPDSFYDGGRYRSVDALVERGLQMVDQGADMLDVGGESTRPGAAKVSAVEEVARVLPVLDRLVDQGGVPVSIDTYKAEVARRALEAGAAMVNDISGLRFDAHMAAVVAARGVPVVVSHIQGTPRTMQRHPTYGDLMSEIAAYLAESIDKATRAGLPRQRVIIDPGIGFGKTTRHNLCVLRQLSYFQGLGCPILVGASRKSFIGKVLGVPVQKRLEGGLAAAVIAVMHGARIIRTHDVEATRRAVDMAWAVIHS